jgi:hypothetical protein
VDRCFSSTYYLLAGLASETIGNVKTPDHQQLLIKANADSGESRNLASSHLLQNVKRAEEYGGKPISMMTIHGDSPAYTHQCELHFSDENGIPIILLCYVQEIPIPGHEDFVLISNTLVDIDTDINFHARASKETGVLPLRRTVSKAFHYGILNKRPPSARFQGKVTATRRQLPMPTQSIPKPYRGGHLPHNGKEANGVPERAL